MADRRELPDRRPSITLPVTFSSLWGEEHTFIVTYGFDADGFVRECFCSSPKAGSMMQAFINDACVGISRLLQRGDTIADLVVAFGEDRQEGASAGPPSSPLGAIARAGQHLEDAL